jgi:ectoine hydroxylase-related dioxygenase (phytanoyl-CoA dioxygenase family)
MQDVRSRAVTAAEIAAYRADGVVCLRQVLDPAWCDRMLAAALRSMDQGGGRARDMTNPDGGGRFYRNTWMAFRDEDFRAFRDEGPVARVAAGLMGASQVRYFYDQLFIKAPGTTVPTKWHQDLPFWPFLGEDIVSCWVALTPATKATSAVEYVAGSHRWDKFYRAVSPEANPALMDAGLEECPDYSDPPPGVRTLCWDMQPGDVLCHHPLVIHGAGGNTSSDRTRVGLSIRYFGRDVRYDPREFTMRLERVPAVPPGAYPADDHAFPPVAV